MASSETDSALTSRLRAVASWFGLGALVGSMAGAMAAGFLYTLAAATEARTMHSSLIWLLPLAGWAWGVAVERTGPSVSGGTNLVVDRLGSDGPPIDWRLGPAAWLGTLVTHLFGGSAGREGTAVQIGGACAALAGSWMGLTSRWRRPLLAAGVAGGFGAVFGTPAAGIVFALELPVAGRPSYEALLPATVASLVGDAVCRALGAHHTMFPAVAAEPSSLRLLFAWLTLSVAVATSVTLFIEAIETLRRVSVRLLPKLRWRLFVGGILVVLAWRILKNDTYLGLSLPLLERALIDPTMTQWAWAVKGLLTVITLSCGFIGGEVTPLFVVGACLGNATAQIFGVDITLAAGVGMVAMFATAANTPLALSVMAVELMGAHILPHVLFVVAVASLLAGHRSIYAAQRRMI